MYGWEMGGYGIFSMIVFWIIIFIAVIYFIRLLIRNTQRGGPPDDRSQGGSGKAIDILKERYARGEIDKAEFEEKKKDLLE